MRSIEEPASSRIQLLGILEADVERVIGVVQLVNVTQRNSHRLRERASDLESECRGRIGCEIAERRVRGKSLRLLGIVLLPEFLDSITGDAADHGYEHAPCSG
jgi:hypothetical protein